MLSIRDSLQIDVRHTQTEIKGWKKYFVKMERKQNRKAAVTILNTRQNRL